MNTWVAFLRGINVGGRNIVPMKDLRSLLVEIGCERVRTYIQSGNVVFRHDEKDKDSLAGKITDVVSSRFGFEPSVMLLSVDDLRAACEANPFPEGRDDPTTLHLFFLADDVTNFDQAGIESRCGDTESFSLAGRVFYLHAPDGIGRSKLAAVVGTLLAVPVTARNWRTVNKVLQLADS